MKYIENIILGAGVGGLSLGFMLENKHVIFERNNKVPKNFGNGVHYLHNIPNLDIGLEYKKIKINETIFDGYKFKDKANLMDAVIYSKKVCGMIQPTSIFSIGKREQCFLPVSNNANDILDKLEEKCKIELNSACEKIDLENKVIVINGEKYNYGRIYSTIPLNVLLKICGIEFEEEMFKSDKINTWNFNVEGVLADWLICIYVSSDSLNSYRLTILNNQISLESIEKMLEEKSREEISFIFNNYIKISDKGIKGEWEVGKVISIGDSKRKNIVEKLLDNEVITFGRYGLWNRKILIDDTINQSIEIKKFISKECEKKELVNYLSL